MIEWPSARFEGENYRWSGREWVSTATNFQPPQTICRRLDVLARERFQEFDEGLNESEQMLKETRTILDIDRNVVREFHLERAENLATRAFRINPTAGPASTLCSALRRRGKAELALAVCELQGTPYPALLTCKAAALCDLGRLPEAERQLKQVLAILHKKGEPAQEALSALMRVRAGKCPD